MILKDKTAFSTNKVKYSVKTNFYKVGSKFLMYMVGWIYYHRNSPINYHKKCRQNSMENIRVDIEMWRVNKSLSFFHHHLFFKSMKW